MQLFDVYPRYEIEPVKGAGAYIFDRNGNQFLDLYGGHAVISVGHGHPDYIKALTDQMRELGFYSNSVKNALQEQLAQKLGQISGCKDYDLFLCNSGAEANENALKLASFHTGRSRVIFFENAFHGRTSGVVAITDNDQIVAPYNSHHNVTKLAFEDTKGLEKELQKGDVAAVILEVIQGVGGLEEASPEFYRAVSRLCTENNAVMVVDEIQAGYGRTGDFFAFQKHGIRPDIISMAKGMGNGFPIGGIMIDRKIQARHGLLGTTFGGNHLACAAGIAVLDILQKEALPRNAEKMYGYFRQRAAEIPAVKRMKGRGLMLGLEFDFEVAPLRKYLLFKHHIFTGAATDKNILRILPPLNITENHFEQFFKALEFALEEKKFWI